MRIDAGLIIGIALEFVIMLYFANSTLQPKKNYYMSSAICFIGYLIIFGVSIFNMFIFNIISFTIIDFLIFILGYRINYKTALFQTFMMTLFMFLGELLILFILKLGLDTESMVAATVQQSMLITIGGKLIYFLAVFVMKKVHKKRNISSEKSSLILAIMPIITVLCIVMVYPLTLDRRVFTAIYIGAISVNFITITVNELVISKNRKIRMLENENYKNSVELEEYKTIKEKYEHSRIMNHDFREHLNILKTLISEDIQKAQEYVGTVEKECEDSKIEKYSDNDILNILLIRKKKECEENELS